MPLARILVRVACVLCGVALSGCTYAKLARPSVLGQLDPKMANLLNELPKVDEQNEAIIGRLFVGGGLSRAKKGEDGIMRASVMIPPGELIWKPSIIVMESPGELELEISNEDIYTYHGAYLPSNGDRQLMLLPIHTRGRAVIELDGPGYYWFGCPVGNHAGRGMLGLILVEGEVPAEAKIDRPKQERP